jgi:hypothetical protein
MQNFEEINYVNLLKLKAKLFVYCRLKKYRESKQ